MKKIVFSLTLLLFVAKSFSQSTALSKDYYLKKSKNKKTVGWLMLGGGVAMTTIGIIIASGQTNDRLNDPFGVDPFSGNEGAAIVAVAGLASALGSIPFFINSAKNARKAAKVSFSTPKLLLPQQNTLAFKIQPTLSLKIGL